MPRQRLQHELQLQTGQVRRVLAEHRMDGRTIHSALHQEENGRRTRFDVRGVLHAGLAQVKALSEDLQRVFREAAVQVQAQDGELNIELTAEQYPVPLLDVLDILPAIPPLTAVLGWTAADQPVLLNLSSGEAAHVLVAGEEGAGKTGLLRSIALSLAMHNRERDLQLVVVDGRLRPIPPSSTSLTSLNYLPHLLTPVIEELPQAQQTLPFLAEMVQERRQGRGAMPAIVVLIDHVVALLEQGGRDMLHTLTYLVRHGGATGVHLILATRRPTSPHLADLYDAYVPARLVGRVANAAVAEIAADALHSGAERLVGEGDFVAIVGTASTHFQAAGVSEYDLHYALEEMYAQRPPVVIAQPFNPRPRLVVAEPAAEYTTSTIWEDAYRVPPPVPALPRIAFRRPSTAVVLPIILEESEQAEDDEEEEYEPETTPNWFGGGYASPPAPATRTWVETDDIDELDDEDEEEEEEEEEFVLATPPPISRMRYQPEPLPVAEVWEDEEEEEDEDEDETLWGNWLPPAPQPIPQPVPPPPPPSRPAPPRAASADDEIPFTWESPRWQAPSATPPVRALPVVDTAEEAPPPRPRRTERPRFNQVRSLLKDVDKSLAENPPVPPITPPQEAEEETADVVEEVLELEEVEDVLLEQFDDGWHALPPDATNPTTIRVTSKQAAVVPYPASLQRQRQRRYQ